MELLEADSGAHHLLGVAGLGEHLAEPGERGPRDGAVAEHVGGSALIDLGGAVAVGRFLPTDMVR